MSCDDIAIRVRDIRKHYTMFARPEDRLKQMIVPRLQRAVGRALVKYYQDFAALNGISFDVRRGETVGIVGRNGSGKSTLLQIVCGTLRPTAGAVKVNGRLAALLELGAGFNPEFTGRENVYLNAAILGLSRAETDERFESIARFADIGMFVDQPVKTYSSGMYVRLAFATAINVDPDILVVDEALAVGDEAFQRKCFARIEDIKDKGGTILLVSHGAQTIVQLCNRALLIDAGEVLLDGPPKMVVSQYQRLVNLSEPEAESVRETIRAAGGRPGEAVAVKEHNGAKRPSAGPHNACDSWFDPNLVSHSRVEYESRGARIRDVKITTLEGRQVNVLRSGERYIYQYAVEFDRDVANVGFGMLIKTVDGIALGGAATDFSEGLRQPKVDAGTCHDVRFDLRWSLNPGTYFVNAGVTGSIDDNHAYSHRLLDALAVRILPQADQVATAYVDFDAKPCIELRVS